MTQPRFRFSDRQRVRSSRDFQRIMDAGVRVTDARLTVWAQPNALGFPRLGLVVGRRHGNAPARNRLKRLIREAFRLSQHELPQHLDLLVSPRAGAPLAIDSLMESLQRVAKRLAAKSPTPDAPQS